MECGELASAIRTYLKRNDFTGKNVAVFSSMSVWEKEKAIKRIKALVSNANIVGELAVSKVFMNQRVKKGKISVGRDNIRRLCGIS